VFLPVAALTIAVACTAKPHLGCPQDLSPGKSAFEVNFDHKRVNFGGNASASPSAGRVPVDPMAAESGEHASVPQFVEILSEDAGAPVVPKVSGDRSWGEHSDQHVATARTGTTHRFRLTGGRQIVIRNSEAAIVDRNGRELARNAHLVSTEAEVPNCTSDGFDAVKLVTGGFAILQRSCGGWYYILEELEFRLPKTGGGARLVKFSITYIDRRSPEEPAEKYLLSDQDLGTVTFAEVNRDELYRRASTQPPTRVGL